RAAERAYRRARLDMRRSHFVLTAAVSFSLFACGPETAPQATAPAAPRAAVAARPDEVHLADLKQLTFGGENAEAYWSWSGDQLILQARGGAQACDRINRMQPFAPQPSFIPVSSGKGTTTCSFFLPG